MGSGIGAHGIIVTTVEAASTTGTWALTWSAEAQLLQGNRVLISPLMGACIVKALWQYTSSENTEIVVHKWTCDCMALSTDLTNHRASAQDRFIHPPCFINEPIWKVKRLFDLPKVTQIRQTCDLRLVVHPLCYAFALVHSCVLGTHCVSAIAFSVLTVKFSTTLIYWASALDQALC